MRKLSLIVLLLLLTPLLVFFPILNHDFVVWDDGINVYENPYLNPVIPASFARFWSQPYEKLCVPVTYSVWALIARFSGRTNGEGEAGRLAPRYFHAANLLVHLVATVVVFSILCLLLNIGFDSSENPPSGFHGSAIRTYWAAAAGAAVFAVHPVQVEPVAWVTGMKDVLCGCMCMAALRLFLIGSVRFRRTNARNGKDGMFAVAPLRSFGVASLFYLLALLAKPSAVVLPLVAGFFLYLIFLTGVPDVGHKRSTANKRKKKRRSFFSDNSRPCLILCVWLSMAVVLVIATSSVQTIDRNYYTPVLYRPLIAGDAVAFYLAKVLLPLGNSIDYGRTPDLVMRHAISYLYLTVAGNRFGILLFVN